MAHIVEYTHKRESQIKKDYATELAKARKIPISFSQIRGNELIETDFTDKELAEIDKMVRETLGKDYKVEFRKKSNLSANDCKKSYIIYGIIHKDLFARSNAIYDKKRKGFNSADTNRIIIRNPEGGYLSTGGYIWFTFEKTSNNDTILYLADDVETFGSKAKYKKHWDKMGHIYFVSDILFNKYLESVKDGIEKVKNCFDKFL